MGRPPEQLEEEVLESLLSPLKFQSFTERASMSVATEMWHPSVSTSGTQSSCSTCHHILVIEGGFGASLHMPGCAEVPDVCVSLNVKVIYDIPIESER